LSPAANKPIYPEAPGTAFSLARLTCGAVESSMIVVFCNDRFNHHGQALVSTEA